MRLLFCFIFSFLCCLPVFSLDLELETTVSTSSMMIGDRFEYRLKLVVPRGTKVLFPKKDADFGEFEVKNQDFKENRLGENLELISIYDMAVYDVGTFIIPTTNVLVQSGEEQFELDGSAITITSLGVSSDAGATDTDLRDVKQPMNIALTWKIFLPLFIVIVVIIVILLLYRYLKKRNISGDIEEVKVKPVDPYAYIKEKFLLIDEETMLSGGMYKAFYSSIMDLLREYIELRFGVDALEMTSRELMDEVKYLKLQFDQRENVKFLLDSADQVKFAKFVPTTLEGKEYKAKVIESLDVLEDCFWKTYVVKDDENG